MATFCRQLWSVYRVVQESRILHIVPLFFVTETILWNDVSTWIQRKIFCSSHCCRTKWKITYALPEDSVVLVGVSSWYFKKKKKQKLLWLPRTFFLAFVLFFSFIFFSLYNATDSQLAYCNFYYFFPVLYLLLLLLLLLYWLPCPHAWHNQWLVRWMISVHVYDICDDCNTTHDATDGVAASFGSAVQH